MPYRKYFTKEKMSVGFFKWMKKRKAVESVTAGKSVDNILNDRTKVKKLL